MQETILLLRQQFDSLLSERSSKGPQESADNEITSLNPCSQESLKMKNVTRDGVPAYEDTFADENTPTSVMSLNRVFSRDDSKECSSDTFSNSQLLMQVIFS